MRDGQNGLIDMAISGCCGFVERGIAVDSTDVPQGHGLSTDGRGSGRNGDVRYLWIPLAAAMGIYYRKEAGMAPDLLRFDCALFAGGSEYYKFCDGFIPRSRRNHRDSSLPLSLILDLHDTLILADGDQ